MRSLLIFAALAAAAQNPVQYSVLVCSTNATGALASCVPTPLGPGLTVSNGQLTTTAAARKYGVALTAAGAGGPAGAWTGLPAGALNVVLYANGLRYQAGVDYTVAGAVVTIPLSEQDWAVAVDYDGP